MKPTTSRQPRGPRARGFASLPSFTALLLAGLLLSVGCKRQHYTTASFDDRGYPTCPGEKVAPEVLLDIRLRSGASDTRMAIFEHFRFEKRGCLFAAVTRQEWPMQIADVEALYDASMKPLRVWRRHTVPGSKRDDGQPDFKLFELRTTPVGIKHKDDAGRIDFETLVPKHALSPSVLIGPGRGNITIWLQQAKLAVGQKVHAPSLDFRGVEKLEIAALERRADMHVDGLGKKVRVYTYFGKETVFADENDVVIGDLAGLVPDSLVTRPKPPPMSRFEPIDPVGMP